MTISILDEKDIRECVKMDREAKQAVAEGFTRLAEGRVTVPPIMRIDVPDNNGEVDVKTAYIHGLDSFAIKIAAGFHDNSLLGLPTGSGMMVLINAKTGQPMAVLLDNGYLTDVRTGLAGALASEYLAREYIQTAGVIGSGMQARYQIRALKLVRNFQRLLVYGISPKEVDQYVDDMTLELGIEVIKTDNAMKVIRQSDIVVTTTPSNDPYLKSEWLHPGLHITCMGSDAENKQELFADVFAQVDMIACDRKSQCFRLGELHHALEESVITPDTTIIELGELTSGQQTGRSDEDQITVCDLTGVGVQDTAIARLAYQRAFAKCLGSTIGE